MGSVGVHVLTVIMLIMVSALVVGLIVSVVMHQHVQNVLPHIFYMKGNVLDHAPSSLQIKEVT